MHPKREVGKKRRKITNLNLAFGQVRPMGLDRVGHRTLVVPFYWKWKWVKFRINVHWKSTQIRLYQDKIRIICYAYNLALSRMRQSWVVPTFRLDRTQVYHILFAYSHIIIYYWYNVIYIRLYYKHCTCCHARTHLKFEPNQYADPKQWSKWHNGTTHMFRVCRQWHCNDSTKTLTNGRGVCCSATNSKYWTHSPFHNLGPWGPRIFIYQSIFPPILQLGPWGIWMREIHFQPQSWMMLLGWQKGKVG